MKSKKLLKYGLPLVATAGLAISLPLALTSCKSDSKSLSFSENLEPVTHVSHNNSIVLQVSSKSENVNYQWLLRNNSINNKEVQNKGWQLIPSQTRSSLFLSSEQVKKYQDSYEFACLIYNKDKTDYKLSNPTKLIEANPTFTIDTNNSNLYPDLNGQYTLNVDIKPITSQVKSNYKYDWYIYNDKNGMQSIDLYKTTKEPHLTINHNQIDQTTYILCAVTNQSTGETQTLSKEQIFTLNYDYIQISDISVDSKIQINNADGETETKTNSETTVQLKNLEIQGKLENPKFKYELLKYDFVTNQFKAQTELQVQQTSEPESQEEQTSNNVTLVLPTNIQNQDVYKIKVTISDNNSIYASKETNPFITLNSSKENVTTPDPITLSKFINNITSWNNNQLSQLNWQKSTTSTLDNSSELIPIISAIGVPTDSYKNSLLTSIGFSDSQISSLNPEVYLQLTSSLEVGQAISIQLTIKLGNSNTWLSEVIKNLKLPTNTEVNLSEDNTTLTIKSSTSAVYTELQSNVTNENISTLVNDAKTWSTSTYLNANNIDSSGQIKKPIANSDETEATAQDTEQDYSQGSLWNQIAQQLWATKSKNDTSSEESTSEPGEDVIESMSLIPSKVVTPGEKYKVTIEVKLNKQYAFDLTKIKNGENGVEVTNGNILKIKDVEIDYAYIAYVDTTSSNVENFISNISGLTNEQLNSMFSKWTDTSKPLTITLSSDWKNYEDIIKLVRESLNLTANQIKQIEVSVPASSKEDSSSTTITNLNFNITLVEKYQFDKNKIGSLSSVSLNNNNQTINISNVSVTWNKTK